MRGRARRRRGRLRSLCEEAGADRSDLENYGDKKYWARRFEDKRCGSDGQELRYRMQTRCVLRPGGQVGQTAYAAKSYRSTRCLEVIMETPKLLTHDSISSELHGFGSSSILRAMVANRQTGKQLQGTSSEAFASGTSEDL
jgi:hypothetical protein